MGKVLKNKKMTVIWKGKLKIGPSIEFTEWKLNFAGIVLKKAEKSCQSLY